MRHWAIRHVAAAVVVTAASVGPGASRSHAQPAGQIREHYDAAYIGAPLADPVLQQSKETYVVFGCAYCHGVNLTPRGEAADLRTSRIVGRDVDGNLLGPLLRAGIPQTAKLSPMPQFSDLSARQIADLVRWMHYARQEARFSVLTGTAPPAGADAAAGRTLFDASCRGCHADEAALRTALSGVDAAAATRAILKPQALQTPRSWTEAALSDDRANMGRARHGALLENVTASEVANLRALLAPAAR
jgi:mono/diheme cytochrome c family protein